MKQLIGIILLIAGFAACKKMDKNTSHPSTAEYIELVTNEYELLRPIENIKHVLVLFGGYPESAKDIKREFQISKIARERNIAIVYMNYNQKLWLDITEKQALATQLENIFVENELPTVDVYIGGFSSGGNVSLLISAYMMENNSFQLKPKGVFVADSPIDLIGLYRSAEKNVKRNFSDISVQESTWIIEKLNSNFGNPESNFETYEKNAVFASDTKSIENLKSLKNTKIRLYTEPDTLWWKTNRMADYDQMNAYYIVQLSDALKQSGFNKVVYIATENKGYRANGDRHPHSWSIIDHKEFVEWILE